MNYKLRTKIMLDLLIIGGSAAGSAAAIYAARRKLNFKIVAVDLGGEVALSGEVNNWLGEQSIQGFELAKKFNDHVKSYGVEIDQGFAVEKIEQKNNYHIITAKNMAGEVKTYEAISVIVATGIHPRKLNIPGEKEFDRKGVTYCTVCDGPLFKEKITATIGAGNSALESAIMMAGIAKKHYLITKYPDTKEANGGFPKGENILIDKVKKNKNVEIIYEANTTEILGEGVVKSLKYKVMKEPSSAKATADEEEIEVQGIMVHAGLIPNSDFIDCVEKDRAGQIMIDAKCTTNVPGIFAAGDVTNVPYKQIAVAAGQGVIAALSAIEYINKHA